MGITVHLPEPVCYRRQSAFVRRVVNTEGGNCYGESQSRSESNGQKDCEASRHRPSMSGVAQAIHIELSENVCRVQICSAPLFCFLV